MAQAPRYVEAAWTMTMINCSLPLPKQKPLVLYGPLDQPLQPSSMCPYTFLSRKCHQQVPLAYRTGKLAPSKQTTRKHGVAHASPGSAKTSHRCPQTFSCHGCSNSLQTVFREPGYMPPPNYPIRSPMQFALHAKPCHTSHDTLQAHIWTIVNKTLRRHCPCQRAPIYDGQGNMQWATDDIHSPCYPSINGVGPIYLSSICHHSLSSL
jgi:hypothetical protein